MTIVSIGTGGFRPHVSLHELAWIRPIGIAIRALSAQIAESSQLVLTLMSWLGDTSTAWPINSELSDVAIIPAPLGQPLFRFLRYDVHLDQAWLASELGVTIDERTLSSYQLMDAPANIPAIYELGKRAAERQITRDHLVGASSGLDQRKTHHA